MGFENLQLEIQGEGEKISQQEIQTEAQKLSDVQACLSQISESKDPAIRKRLENSNLQQEILQFLEQAANNSLSSHLSEFNASEFDNDGENGLDRFEFGQFNQALTEAIEQIILLDGMGKFSDIHEDSADRSFWSNPDKWASVGLDFGGWLQEMGVTDEKTLASEGLQKLGLLEEDLQKMSEKSFDPLESESWKDLGILLSKELGEGVEMILKFLGNVPAGIVLIPRYLNYRVDINSSDVLERTEGEIKIQELVEDNPSLALLDLLGEKGVEMLKQLGEMITSGKTGDIAMLLVSIAGLLAGGAGVVKLGAKFARRSAVRQARQSGREGRDILGRQQRNALKDSANRAEAVQRGAEKVDDIVGGAGIGHLTGAFATGADGIRTSTGVAPDEILRANANLSDTQRADAASALLGRNLTDAQQKALLTAHNYEQGQNVAKGKALMDAGFTKEETRILMDQGIAGKFDIILQSRYERLADLPDDLQDALRLGTIDKSLFLALNKLKWLEEFSTEKLQTISSILRNNSPENARSLLADPSLLWNEGAVDMVLEETNSATRKMEIVDKGDDYGEKKLATLDDISDPLMRDLLSLRVSRAFIEQNFTSENLSRLSLEEYIALLQQAPARFVTHVTRHGIKDRSSHHSESGNEFHRGFENMLESRAIQSIHDQTFQGSYTRENVESSLGRIGSNNQRVNNFLYKQENDHIKSEFADANAVHGAIDYVGDNFYGAETGNSIFVIYPASYIASEYKLAHQNGNVPKGFYDNDPSGKYNDIWMMRAGDNRGALPLDAGIVFIPKNTRVDPNTGSRYKIGMDEEITSEVFQGGEGISAKEYWESHFEKTGEKPSKVIFYDESDPNAALEAFRERYGLYNTLGQNVDLTDMFPENMLTQQEMRTALDSEAQEYERLAQEILTPE